MPTYGMRTTSGATGMGGPQSIDPFLQTQTVFSGADPAIADIAGTSGITQGLYPQAANTAIAGSWLQAVTGGPAPSAAQSASSDGSSSSSSSTPTASATTTVITFVIAVVLLLAGAFALVSTEAAS